MKIGIINSNVFHCSGSGYRIDPDVHLSDGVQAREQLAHSPYELSTVGENASQVFLGNIFSRVFVKDKEHGMPYLAASDTVLANIETGRFLSNKQAKTLKNLILKKDWILITCSGTLGNVTYTNKTFENHIATHDLIRVVPNDNKVNKGTLYVFLSGIYGYNQITQSQFGGVVKHINDIQTKAILVPVFPESFQQEVDDLIQESARLREEATDALDKAHTLLHSAFNNKDTNIKSVSIKKIYAAHNQRFEASYYVSNNRNIYDSIVEEVEFMRLKDLCTKIFRPGIFKRQYVTEGGITFLGGADILNAIPSSYKQLSKPQVKRMPELMPKQGTILVTCGGTIGNTVYVDNQLATCAVSQHVMRLVPNGEVHNGYLYAFLSSEIGKKLINLFAFGSVIPQIEAHHLELIPVPILDDETMNSIDALCMQYVSYNEIAKEKERKAISMVETEIESWTTSKKN